MLTAIRAANDQMDEDEVPQDNRYLFITPTLMGMIQDLDTTKSKAVLENFAAITKVPQTRFYTKITQRSGKTSVVHCDGTGFHGGKRRGHGRTGAQMADKAAGAEQKRRRQGREKPG